MSRIITSGHNPRLVQRRPVNSCDSALMYNVRQTGVKSCIVYHTTCTWVTTVKRFCGTALVYVRTYGIRINPCNASRYLHWVLANHSNSWSLVDSPCIFNSKQDWYQSLLHSVSHYLHLGRHCYSADPFLLRDKLICFFQSLHLWLDYEGSRIP